MKKFLKIALPIILVGLFLVSVILYSQFPKETEHFVELVKEFFNQPLPIAGLSTLTIGGLILLIIKYIVSKSKYGQSQIAEVRKELSVAKEELKEYKLSLIEKQRVISNFALQQNNKIIELCHLIPNVKVNEFADKIQEGNIQFEKQLNEIDERIIEYVEKGKESSNN